MNEERSEVEILIIKKTEELNQLYKQYLPEGVELRLPVPWPGNLIPHAYRNDEGFYIDVCPRCQDELDIRILCVSVSTDGGYQSCVGPYASVCDSCECCVIDEMALEEHLFARGLHYYLPLGVYPYSGGSNLKSEVDLTFQTFENETFEIIDDESGHPMMALYHRACREMDRFLLEDDKTNRNKRKRQRKRQKEARKKSRK